MIWLMDSQSYRHTFTNSISIRHTLPLWDDIEISIVHSWTVPNSQMTSHCPTFELSKTKATKALCMTNLINPSGRCYVIDNNPIHQEKINQRSLKVNFQNTKLLQTPQPSKSPRTYLGNSKTIPPMKHLTCRKIKWNKKWFDLRLSRTSIAITIDRRKKRKRHASRRCRFDWFKNRAWSDGTPDLAEFTFTWSFTRRG